MLPESTIVARFRRWFSVERGLLLGGIALLAGLLLIGEAVREWWAVDFGNLEYEVTTRWVISGATLTALGVQIVLGSFFVAIFDLAPASASLPSLAPPARPPPPDDRSA